MTQLSNHLNLFEDSNVKKEIIQPLKIIFENPTEKL